MEGRGISRAWCELAGCGLALVSQRRRRNPNTVLGFAKDSKTGCIALCSHQCRLEYHFCRACGRRRVSLPYLASGHQLIVAQHRPLHINSLSLFDRFPRLRSFKARPLKSRRRTASPVTPTLSRSAIARKQPISPAGPSSKKAESLVWATPSAVCRHRSSNHSTLGNR